MIWGNTGKGVAVTVTEDRDEINSNRIKIIVFALILLSTIIHPNEPLLIDSILRCT